MSFEHYRINKSLNTNNLHIELISSEPDIIMRRVTGIVNGIGNGDFHLGNSFVSGISPVLCGFYELKMVTGRYILFNVKF